MSKLTGQFRSTQWDPLLIIAQIIALQSVYYVCLGLWLAAVNLLAGTSRSLEHIFRYQVSFLAVFKDAITGVHEYWSCLAAENRFWKPS